LRDFAIRAHTVHTVNGSKGKLTAGVTDTEFADIRTTMNHYGTGLKPDMRKAADGIGQVSAGFSRFQQISAGFKAS
jgi:hypothetical protein